MAIPAEQGFHFFYRRKSITPSKMDSAHFHETHELYYLEKGSTKYFIGDELFILEPGDIIFVPKGAFHKTDSEKSSFERILLAFDDAFLGEEYMEYLEDLKKNKYVKIASGHLYEIQDIFHKIEAESANRKSGYFEMERLYLKQLLILIKRYRMTDNVPQLNETFAIIQNAAKYISDNLASPLTLDMLAKIHTMSPSHFSRQFKLVTGIGLNEYINISRVSAAEKLLLTTNMPITRIAMECGFNDSNYFAAVFKKIKGITPKKYSLLYK